VSVFSKPVLAIVFTNLQGILQQAWSLEEFGCHLTFEILLLGLECLISSTRLRQRQARL
jgi:hypothetical protein